MIFSPAAAFLGTCEGAFSFLGRRGEDVRDLQSTGSQGGRPHGGDGGPKRAGLSFFDGTPAVKSETACEPVPTAAGSSERKMEAGVLLPARRFLFSFRKTAEEEKRDAAARREVVRTRAAGWERVGEAGGLNP